MSSPSVSGEPPGGVRGSEEPRVVVGAATHVLELQGRAGELPALHVDLLYLDSVRYVETGRPGDAHVAEAEGESGARVVRETAVALSPVTEGDARCDHREPTERVGCLLYTSPSPRD